MKLELRIEPEIIIKRGKKHHAAHHGGAWKIAYADFVTAMMTFFMLMWILGATDENQRRGIADYFTPTIIQMKNSGGSNGIMGGRALESEEGVAPRATMSGRRPVAMTGGGGMRAEAKQDAVVPKPVDAKVQSDDEDKFRTIERRVAARVAGDPTLKGLKGQIRFVRVQDGLRIDIVERADFAMFGVGNARFSPAAAEAAMVKTVADTIGETPNRLTVRSHTDSLAYGTRGGANNWTLSTLRADATRQALAAAGIDEARFRRIEGVADTDPFNAEDLADPSNRRISVTFLYRGA
jgi:chemotaxis protein MotB